MVESSCRDVALNLKPSPVPTFQTLPPELRFRIFKWLFQGETVAYRSSKEENTDDCFCHVRDPRVNRIRPLDPQAIDCHCCDTFSPSRLHNILLVNSQCHQEGAKLYLSTASLVIYQGCGPTLDFISSAPVHNWSKFRVISVTKSHLNIATGHLRGIIELLEQAKEITFRSSGRISMRRPVKKIQDVESVLRQEIPVTKDSINLFTGVMEIILQNMQKELLARKENGFPDCQVFLTYDLRRIAIDLFDVDTNFDEIVSQQFGHDNPLTGDAALALMLEKASYPIIGVSVVPSKNSQIR